MTFLYRPRSIHFHSKQPSQTPLPPAVENVLQKKDSNIRPRTNSMGARHIMKRFSSIFLSKKKPQLPDLKLANSVTSDHHHITTVYVASYASSSESIDSVDDIRRPSGLGQAVPTMSNRSLSSPFLSSFESSPCPNHDYQRIRALSSPNLLQSFSKPKVNPKSRSFSISNDTIIESELTPSPLSPLPPSPLVPSSCLPKDVTVHILSYLPRGTIASCSQVSKSFAEAARYNLYNTLNFDSMSLFQLEQLLAVLASRRDLTELVSTFICHKWPPFFITDCHCRGGPPTTGYIFQHKDVLLTATFTLALEGMTNITSLTLPAFDASLLAHHSAFGLKRLTFTNHTISESDSRALFAWLDGQTNIVSLRFTNLEDIVITPIKNMVTVPYHRNTICGTPPSVSPPVSPRSLNFHQQSPTLASPFSSPNLLPNLVELHATPSILTLLALPPPQSQPIPSSFPPSPSSLPFPPSPPILRPLTTVSLNITTTLYTGLRPATLMNQLRGVSHLCLKFGRAVDRRTFEKVVGAAGGVLGGAEGEDTRTEDGEWIGLRSLEVGFHDSSSKHSRRDEVSFIWFFFFYFLSPLLVSFNSLY